MSSVIRHPKYAFGLLQTPSDSENGKSGKVHGASSSASVYPSFSSSSADRTEQQSNLCTPKLQNRTSSKISSSSLLESCSSSIRTPRGRKKTSTPRTASSSVSNDVNSTTLVAVVEGRGVARGEIGMTSLDLSQPVLNLSQFSDSQTYSMTLAKLQNIHPVEILLPNTICDAGDKNKLLNLITCQFPNVTISSVQRRYFSETKGLQYVKQLCATEYKNIELQISTKYYCLATTGALLKYMEFIQNVMFAPNSLKAVFKGCENSTMIDSATVKNLELLQNLRDPISQHSLFGILNYTKTAGGGRLLRSNILQPPSDEETIVLRHGAIAELTEKEDIFFGLQSVLSKFVDIGHIISVCVQIPKQETLRSAESKLNCVIALKHVLQLVEPLKEHLSYCENKMLKMYYKALDDVRFKTILEKIGEVINDATHLEKGALQQHYQRCAAIKTKINGLLDVARRTYTELVDDLESLVQQCAENYQLPLRTAYSSLRGFYIQMSIETRGKRGGGGGAAAVSQDNLPSVFIKVNKFKNTLSFTTMELLQLNERIKSALDQIYMMGNFVTTDLLTSLQGQVSCLYELADIVAMVDMLLSLAHAATLSSYIRPEFTDTLAIKQGYHPILQKVSCDIVVPNDTYAADHSNFIVLTGPNMGGKSTYLRQVALLQIMAQIGSFVPAQFASFRIADQIFSRIGSDDDMESNSSTFTLEMKETNYILQNVTDNSLVIIDELGRGTSAEEGVGICWAISECLLKKKAFTFFVTHFRQLTDLNRNYPNVSEYYFEVQRVFNAEARCEKISYTHVLSRGVTPETHYGLQLASMSTIPTSVIEDARKIADNIEQRREKTRRRDIVVLRQHADFSLAMKLIQVAKNSRMDEDALRMYLKSLRKTYLAELEKLTTTANAQMSTSSEE
ncbi:mutS protein homolog 4 [Aplysia californica]|uniref:MutS protein homolog 4 n=1 Tax=Aplysia californica TaxID=6500 RepID=A0ABM1VQ06_APLCA|nr:mutS protein homolog 4 [Aplysia californica]